LSFLIFISQSIPLPKWPARYAFKGTWNIPYWKIKEPFHIQVDTKSNPNRYSENTYNGRAMTIHYLHQRKFTIQAHSENGVKNDTCYFSDINPDESGAYSDKFIEYLPSDDSKWDYKGIFVTLGKRCHMWELNEPQPRDDWVYRFYVDNETMEPVRYFQRGKSIRGSHPTDYYLDFEEFGTTIDESEFYTPTTCINASDPDPGPKKYSNDISLPKHSVPKNDYTFEPLDQPYCKNITQIANISTLPEEFSWRDYPIVPTVRDQANCGSCWAQAATEALSAQFSLIKGTRVSTSAQQMVDCAWQEPTNLACNGGEGYAGYNQYIKKNISITTEEEYSYIGVAGYCPTAQPSNILGRVTGCSQFKEQHDPKHTLLKQALYKYGPLMVSIRAGVDPFVSLSKDEPYYSNQEFCDVTSWDANYVDHGVLFTGWKKHNGKTYLEIENSWSTFWGSEGYGYIDEEFDCGIESMVLIPQVELA